MDYTLIRNVVGILVFITGILDAIKYYIQGNKIKKIKSSRGVSRRFINFAIVSDITKIAYSIVILDIYIFAISILASFCMFYMFWQIYVYYPYRNRKKRRFKRPNIVAYTINSILPNSIRKKLWTYLDWYLCFLLVAF